MKTSEWLAIALVALACSFAPSAVWAQTCDAYHPVKPNGERSPALSSSSATDHINFFFYAQAGRSYSIEILNVARSYIPGNLSVNVNSGTNCPTTSFAGLSDITTSEPTPGPIADDFRRYSYTATASGFVDIRAGSTGGAVQLQASVWDTTLFSNWFFLASDYNAFTLIRNTTASSVSFRINWRNAAGTTVATTTGTLAANGSSAVSAASFPGAVGAVSGAVEISHNGPPGAIAASTTVLSATTGLSFDAPFVTRP